MEKAIFTGPNGRSCKSISIPSKIYEKRKIVTDPIINPNYASLAAFVASVKGRPTTLHILTKEKPKQRRANVKLPISSTRMVMSII